MAPTLLQKLFNKRANAASPSKNSKEGPGFSWTLAEFHVNQIRLIVYQDCERRGRHVLFDSKAVHRVDGAKVQKTSDDLSKLQGKCCHTSSSSNYTQNSSSSSASNTKGHMPRYQYSRPASDVNMLGEMMFGSVAMSYKGSTLKIHHIRSPPQLMISKVFSAKMGTAGGSSNMLHDSFEYINQENFAGKPCPGQNGGSNFHAFNNLGRLVVCGSKLLLCPTDAGPLPLIRSASFFAAHSTPVDMPSRGQNEDGDSGIARSASLSSLLITPLPSPNSSFSTNCASSFQRRWLRNQTTSLENGILPRWSAEEKFMMADESYTCNPQMVRRKKIAISVVFSLPEKEEENRTFQEFFFSHFPLFETHLNKLKTAIEKAMISSRKIAESSQRVQVYISRVMEGLGEFRTTIYNLYSAPRITDPAWLTMMFNTSEKNKLCHRFVRDFTLLIEQLTKNQFLSALLTAVLTYHLAWVPTVMPNDLPPIKTFHEKHASQNVNLLGKSHPYNPLWAQLGDLYGAIGSPVRLTKTVVVGKRKELVQQILYVLTYFIRCSDLQENEMLWKGKLSESETAQSGAMISTILEKGEVEKSEYVVVTVHKDDPGPMTPIQSLTNAGQRTAVIKDKHTSVDSGLRPSSSGNTELDTCVRQTSEQCCRVSSVGNETNLDNTVSLRAITAPVQETKLQSVRDTVACNDEEHTHEADGLVKSSPDLMSLGTVKLAPTIKSADSSASTGINCPERPLQRSPRLQDRVMFQLGCSFSPDSDIDSRRRVVERNIEQKNGEKSTDFPIPKDTALSEIDGFCQPVVDQSEVTEVVERVEAKRQHHLSRVPHEKNILECFTENNSIEASTLRELTAKVACSNKTDAAAESSVPSGQNDKEVVETMRTCNMKTASVMVSSSSGDQNSEGRIISDIPYGEKEGSGKKSTLRIDGDIPRNESSDSALGDSDDEESSHNPLKQGLECCNETQARVAKFELLAPSVKMNSKPSLNNFGRSLFGGYCPQYVPDFVLHGINSDEKLKHCLMADLAHAVQHPVLDEPIAEAICIIADTDKWSVQVATSQRKAVDNKLGKEILVSNFVSCLLQSILQLYKLQLPADFCVIHLEDRLQELYFKSKMLSEYLKGHARVHVKELGMVLGIESSDLPLLSAIASTHSPSVAQILL
ncbi:folliculin-interacting protein 2-like isoform X1 [Hypanus sabinus]|uniref:folliculin-interacting protein 2-like isoform X1 n=1 Tax=Hypanus sabinus TaxID=79690 RepID=UPI0028C3F245|nr:folliculin-interacting protein 2-like isoform X1 [Hypanus sabinus]